METLNVISNSSDEMVTDSLKPCLKITEEPITNFRFRYQSEMHGTHGCLTGLGTNELKKTFPTAELMNFHGEAIIRCSLFQVDTFIHHSHNLVVSKDNDDAKDPHDVKVSPAKGYTAIFKGMGIIRTQKKYIVNELHEKLIRRKTFEKGRDITQWENQQLRTRAESEAKNMNLNKVRLCFEAFQSIDDNWVSICEPVFSHAINNMKNALTGELKITRLSTNISEASGNEEVFLFVELVGKNDIKVRFFQTDENNKQIWEAWGKFTEADVHHQYAIALRTPPYRDKDIEETVDCYIQLFRPSDECYSDAKPFRYKPNRAVVSRKRARANIPYNSSELPTPVNEVNESGVIADVINEENQEDLHFEDFLNDLVFTYNAEELESLIGPAAVGLLGSSERGEELETLVPASSFLKTDCAVVSNTKESSTQLCPEELIPSMQKIVIRNSTAAENFVRTKYPNDIKKVQFEDFAPSAVTTSENEEIFASSKDNVFDGICPEQLCQFNRSDKWNRLARCIDLKAFVRVWVASKNLSRILFKFPEQFIDIFKRLNESIALVYVDEMIARQLEDELETFLQWSI